MAICTLVFLGIVSGQAPGHIEVTELSMTPRVVNAFAAQFSITFSTEFPVPAQKTEISVTSPYPLIPKMNRADCFLLGLPGVYIDTCDTDEHHLTVTLNGNEDRDVTGPFNLTVLRAFDAGQSNRTDDFSVATLWYGEELNRNDSAGVMYLSIPKSKVSNLSMSLVETMEFTFTLFQLNFTLNSMLRDDMQIRLVFPEEFDPKLGRVDERSMTLVCSASPIGLSPVCSLGYYSLNISIQQQTFADIPISINISEFRMPKSIDPSSQIQVFIEEGVDVVATNSSAIISVNQALDITCCIQYNRTKSTGCSNQELLRACLAFHFTIAEFTNDMSAINVKFKTRINITECRKPGGFCGKCENIIAPKTMKLLGSDPVCRWTEETVLTIFLGAYNLIENSEIDFIPGVLYEFNSTKPMQPNRVPLLYPKKLPTPHAAIATRGTISKCGAVMIDCLESTGTGRRDMQCVWFVEGEYYSTGPILNLKQRLINPYPDGLITVGLIVTNSWNKHDTAETQVVVSIDSDLKVSFPFGVLTQFYYSDTFYFYPDIQISPCAAQQSVTFANIERVWHSNSTLLETSCNLSKLSCTVFPKTLAIDYYYLTLELKANTTETNFTGQVRVAFKVSPSRMSLVIQGGNRTMNINENNTISGEKTVDPDKSAPWNSLVLSWTLINENRTQTDYGSVFGVSFTISPNSLLPNKTYYIHVETPKMDHRDLISMDLWINTTTYPVVKTVFQTPTKVNPFDIVKINAKSYIDPRSDNVLCLWSQISNHNYQGLSSLSAPIFVFSPESLDEGLVYTFQYLCTIFDGNASYQSIAQTSIYVNEPPSGGVCDITPSDGVELHTEFTLMAKYWQDNDGDYPLRYQYYNEKAGSYFPFTPAMLQTTLRTVLARYSQADNEIIILYVCDTLGACKRTRESVILLSSEETNNNRIAQAFASIASVESSTSDYRGKLTTSGQISNYIRDKTTAGSMSSADALQYLANITMYLNKTAEFLMKEKAAGLATEDQESLLAVVMKTMIPGVISNSLISQSEEMLLNTLNLSQTRYTTGEIYVSALSSMQESVHLSLRTNETIPEDQMEVSDRIHSFADKVLSEIVNQLSPGQYPVIRSEAAMSVYAVRNSSSNFNQFTVQLSVHYGNTTGLYNITLDKDIMNQFSGNAEVVVEEIVHTLIIPPTSAQPFLLPHILCENAFYWNDTESLISRNSTCRNYTIATPAPLTTVYPRCVVKKLGLYDQSTGTVDSNNSALITLDSGVVTHQIPMVQYNGEVQCSSYDESGVLDSGMCTTRKRNQKSVTCDCVNTNNAFISTIATVETAVKSLGGTYDGDEISRMFSSDAFSHMGLMMAVLFCVILLCVWFFVSLDRGDKADMEKIIDKFNQYVNDIVKDLSAYPRCVRTGSRLYFWRRNNKETSLNNLFGLFHANEKDSKRRLIAGIKDALAQIKNTNNSKWSKCDVLSSFSTRLSSDSFLCYVSVLYSEMLLSISSSSSIMPDTNYHLFTDDLIKEKNLWAEFLWNNEFLGLFFNRKPSSSRCARLPIFVYAFLGPMTFYAGNQKNYQQNRLISIGSLLMKTNGAVWVWAGWEATFVISGISIAFGIIVEKLIVYIKPPKFSDLTKIEKAFPKKIPLYKAAFSYFLSLVVPNLICGALGILILWYTVSMDTNNVLSVIWAAMESFAIGIIISNAVGIALVAPSRFIDFVQLEKASIWIKLTRVTRMWPLGQVLNPAFVLVRSWGNILGLRR